MQIRDICHKYVVTYLLNQQSYGFVQRTAKRGTLEFLSSDYAYNDTEENNGFF